MDYDLLNSSSEIDSIKPNWVTWINILKSIIFYENYTKINIDQLK